ncbi:MAG: hypothetical protein AAFV25_01895 [Bacteroidota bacterium]
MITKAPTSSRKTEKWWLFIKERFLKLAVFASVFLLVKISGFISALWLSKLVTDVGQYGLFEYALSVGLLIAIPLNVGLQVAYPYFNIKLRERGYRSLFYLHPVLYCSLIGLILIANHWWLGSLAPKHQLALLIGGIIGIQMMLSFILKSHEIISRAVLLDGGIFLVVNTYNLYIYLSGEVYRFDHLQYLLELYLMALVSISTYHFWINRQDFSWESYRDSLLFGRHLVLSSMIIIGLTNGARILIEYFLGLEQVAFYSFYLRFAVAIILLQQVCNIVLFKKMYRSNAEKLDSYFSLFLVGALLLSLSLWWVVPHLLYDWFPFFQEMNEMHQQLYYILSLHTIFWVSMAFNENIIYREGLSSFMNRAFGVLFLMMLGVVWGMHQMGWLDLISFAFVNLCFLFLAADIQFALLRKHKDIRLRHNRLTNRLILLFFLLSYCLIF